MTLTEAVASEVRANLARHSKAKKDLATALGCSTSHVSKLISGNRPMTTEQIELVASFLGLPYQDLFPQWPAAVSGGE